MDLDAGMSAADAVLSSRNIDDVGPELHGVVVANHTSVLEAEELVEPAVLRPGDPRRGGVLRRDHEAAGLGGGGGAGGPGGIARGGRGCKGGRTGEGGFGGVPQPPPPPHGPWWEE